MKADRRTYPAFQNIWDNAEDTKKVKHYMKVSKGIDQLKTAYQSEMLGRRRIISLRSLFPSHIEKSKITSTK